MNPIEEYEAGKAMRRSRGRWRIIALILLAAAAVFAAMKFNKGPSDHIARFSVEDVIYDDPERDALLKKIAENESAKALILRINSPGGTVTGSEALYESLREIAAEKPVVATMSQIATSGGYAAAIGTDQIFARKTTMTGSVGVVFMMPNAHELLDKVGIEMFEMKSGAQKAEPTPYKPVSPDVIEVNRLLLEDNFEWFLSLVKERRDLGENAVATISDGRVVSGRMALELGLIDAIGDEDDALEWLDEEKGISDLEVVEYTPRAPLSLAETLLAPLGISFSGASVLSQTGARGGIWAIHR